MSNSSWLSLSLIFTSQQVVIYVGIFLFIMGLIGHPLVLTVFLSLKTFRQSSCAFYLTIMSLINSLLLFAGLFTFIMINGFGINWTAMSLFYCKIRMFYVQICILLSFTCMCLAIIDQYLATCSNPRWHRFNNIKIARYIIMVAVIVWVLHGIPSVMYNQHILSLVTGKPACAISNAILQKYYTGFYLTVLSSSLPIIIMLVFGILAYRNVKNIAHRTVPLVRRELDKQLTVIVLVQVFVGVFAVIPQIIYSFYSLIIGTPSDTLTATIISFGWNIATISYYFHFMDSFCIYFFVSKRFRQQLMYVLFTIHLNRWCPRIAHHNQVEPQI